MKAQSHAAMDSPPHDAGAHNSVQCDVLVIGGGPAGSTTAMEQA